MRDAIGCARTENSGSNKIVWGTARLSLELGFQNERFQVLQSLAKQYALLCERHRLFHRCAKTEELTYPIEGTTEACCSYVVSKATHWVIPLFDATVVLLQPIIEIGITAMDDVPPERFTDR